MVVNPREFMHQEQAAGRSIERVVVPNDPRTEITGPARVYVASGRLLIDITGGNVSWDDPGEKFAIPEGRTFSVHGIDHTERALGNRAIILVSRPPVKPPAEDAS